MTAKFQVPSAPAWLVSRPRLVDRITRGVEGPLTVVSGPAGAGKTVLAGSWVARGGLPWPVAWITLDRNDSPPGVFWSYVLAGLAHGGVPVKAMRRRGRADAADRSLLIRLAVGLSARPDPVILVLDNAHVLAGRSTPDGLDYLIRHAGSRLRVMLLGRGNPGLPLHRYRAAGHVTEIGFTDLAFTAGETRSLLAAHGVDPPERAVIALTRHTGGWAAGLRLTARGMPHQPPDDTGRYPDGWADLADYFRAEVLDPLPAGVREFLLHTSVAPRLWPALAAELAGRSDAGRLLAGLARADTFVAAAADDAAGYEYYPVVRQLLRAQLDQDSPERVPVLHRRAARWYAAAGQPADAVAHAAAAGDWEHAASLVVDGLAIGRLFDRAPAHRLAEVFAGMPPDLDTPGCAVVQAALALSAGDPAACADHLGRARDLTDDDAGPRTWALRLSVLVTDLARARACGHLVEARSAAEVAETTIAHMRRLGIDVPAELSATVLLGKADGLLWHGGFAAASHALTSALRDPDDAPGARVQAACLGRLALIEALGGRLRRATDLARRAHLLADRFDLPPGDRPPAADVALAWVGAEEYDLAAGRIHANRAAAALAGRYDPLSAAPLALARARIRRGRGERHGTAEVAWPAPPVGATALPAWLADLFTVADATRPGPAPVVTTSALESATTPRGVLARAVAAVAAGDVPAGQRTASALLRDADLPHDARVDCWLLIAAAELANNRPHQTRGVLLPALGAAEVERLRRPVRDAPPRLLRFLRQDRRLCERHGWLGPAVLAGDPADHAGSRPSAVIVEPLTARETEVLTHLAALCSTEEIARSMYLSVNTVKTHVRGVLRKLAASRRNEAVRRARELGLI